MLSTETTIHITVQQIQDHPFIKDGSLEFYKLLSNLLGQSYDHVTKINTQCIFVSVNLWNKWLDDCSTSDDWSTMMSAILDFGPKVEPILDITDVYLIEGAFTFTDRKELQTC